MDLKRLISVARGDAPADLVLSNARVINTFTGEVEETSVAVSAGRVAGVGDYTDATQVVDLRGKYLSPGLIDGHVHLESSMLQVDQYAQAVVPRGTLAAVTDLHEIANVCGLEGIRYMVQCSRRMPLDLFFMAPSCVPATPLETSGARLGPRDIQRVLRWRGVLGLGEMMNFPGVVQGNDEVLSKINIVGHRTRDGHAPRLRGKMLNAYLCPLISSDHETTEYEEGQEKLRRGMHLMIREGSTEKNLEALLPLVNDGNYHRCMLVVDDRSARDLYYDGDMDAVVRKAIHLGLDPVRAIQMASLNTARYFGLEGLGGIAPGYFANLVVLDELRGFQVEQVYYRGRLVAQKGRALFKAALPLPQSMTRTMHIKPFTPAQLALRAEGTKTLPVIEIVPGQIITRRREEVMPSTGGSVVPDLRRDILKLVVVERHKATGNIGIGLVKGFGLKRGALGTSVAHDSHNIVVVGTNNEDIYLAVKEIERNQGGLAAVDRGRIVASLALPVAGLLSLEPLEAVAHHLEELDQAARDLGCVAPSPFSILSFLALPVIPELKLTDRGLVDVMAGRLLPGA